MSKNACCCIVIINSVRRNYMHELDLAVLMRATGRLNGSFFLVVYFMHSLVVYFMKSVHPNVILSQNTLSQNLAKIRSKKIFLGQNKNSPNHQAHIISLNNKIKNAAVIVNHIAGFVRHHTTLF